MAYYQEVEELTVNLVQIPSINNTEGERVLAEYIANLIRGWDYFHRHPDQIWEVPIENDPLGRINVFALVKGEKEPSRRTVVIHGHVDTVGVEDFGSFVDCAFDPLKLAKQLEREELTQEVRNDLKSGEWMFGRGALDMKSGLAVHLAVLRKMSESAESFSGNVLFMANPVEENQHTGVIHALSFLQELKEEEGLEYTIALNTDCFTPAFPGDTNKYIYMGSVGKLLPCFYIVGKETHVGQCFAGLDPNLIAAELVKRIDLNATLCDEYDGAYTLPPATLKMSDLKPTYNVQTPLAAFLYFNYFSHQRSVREVIDQLKAIAVEAFQSAIDHTNTQNQLYCRQTGNTFAPSPYHPKVVSYEEFYREVSSTLGEDLRGKLAELTKKLQAERTDPRLICLAVVEEVRRLWSNKDPIVVVYFSPPYCPHNTVGTQTARGRAVRETVQQLAQEAGRRYGESFKIEHFFPALSDSSFLALDDDEASIDALVGNFPEWHTIYPVPVGLIRKTNIPALTFGVCGKDAHCWTERLYKPYSFGILPEFIEITTRAFLAKRPGKSKERSS